MMKKLSETIFEILGDLPVDRAKLISFIYNYLYSARFRILLNFRIGKFFFTRNNIVFRHLGRSFKYKLVSKRGCDISYNAKIGRNLRLPHPIGIVIGDGVVIKNNVSILQHVTIGNLANNSEKNYPIIENGVKIFAGAKVLGGIVIGENAVIGANSVVLVDVPKNSVAIGVPARILKKK